MSQHISGDGSPTPRKSRSGMMEDLRVDTTPEGLGAGVKRPLGISKAINQLPVQSSHQSMERMMTEGSKKLKVGASAQDNDSSSVVDTLLQRLSEQSSSPLNPDSAKTVASREGESSSTGSMSITPATEDFPNAQSVTMPKAQFEKLQSQLMEARSEITRVNQVNQELSTAHEIHSTFDHHVNPPSEADYPYKGDVSEQTISQLQNKFNASTRAGYGRQDSWIQDDTTGEKNNARSFGQAIWANGSRQPQYPVASNAWGMNANAQQGYGGAQSRPLASQPYRRNGYLNEPTHFPLDQGFRGGLSSNPPSRPASAFDGVRYNQYSAYSNQSVSGGNISPTMQQMSGPPMGVYAPGTSNAVTPYQPRPIGTMATRLSPEAAEFSVDEVTPTPWNTQVNSTAPVARGAADMKLCKPNSESVQYAAFGEPINYRRLLDRNINCNWKYIVDKIICHNDQQASIFLQQKLKVGTVEQKYDIVEAIIAQAYPLMVNRFGNFLVQRCFEHGTPEQIIAIAQTIRGNTLTLSMDAFGCHVIQKAFDAVPEEYKATMVHELLRRIPDTVIHRYACHVWQKLFELRWSDSPPQIMRYVNEALRGMWHEVALGETGSLVVQNIFENCLEEDKRPCINEVLASIDVIAHGQFGNWCIQHICEHGATGDRNRAIDHILRFATEYSMDQYASKVIEKCLKIGGDEFLARYLERVCEGRQDRPRMPLIDIAGDQFGNYLIQYILTHSGAHHREIVASHVRKHMVSLRGSKYGSRVAMLCCNPASITRPGPPTGMQVNRYTAHNGHRNSAYGGFR